MQHWHVMPAGDVVRELESSDLGLSAQEAALRLREFGSNALPEPKTRSIFALFFSQFRSPLIYVLMAAAATVLALGETHDALIILGVLVFNALVGAVQEGRAQQTLDALKHYVETTATVLREGEEYVIPDREVVPGDIIILREGDRVPADARMLSVQGLRVDESSLTGESVAVHKVTEQDAEESSSPADQLCMVFRGTHVVAGSGMAVVCATGMHTVIGGIAERITTIDTEIPLKAEIRTLSQSIIKVVAVLCVSLFSIGVAAGHSVPDMFKTVVSLSVSVIPEGLPIVLTIVLATGVWRMSKRNALVKRLQAVESLGQARVIAVDKTGTVTRNELVVRTAYTDGTRFSVEGLGYEPKGSIALDGATVDAANHPEFLYLAKLAAFSANASLSFSEQLQGWRITGDPTEGAMLVFAQKAGFRKSDLERESPLLGEIAFDYGLKYHTTLHQDERGAVMTVAGAPEAVLALCHDQHVGAAVHPLHASAVRKLEAAAAAMSEDGLRVIALAAKHGVSGELSPDGVKGLTFVGFLGMQDTLRPEARNAVERARAAGVRVVMITGDHKITARAIAAQAGIWQEGDTVLTGAEIDTLSDDELARALNGVSVFARVTPDHKMRIIGAFKARGEIVAMTGDGVNDAPSLVAADLGVAMGKGGTEVAKEAADIVLLDDNFGSIVSAIEEGRAIYKTIKKVILYLFSTSAGEVLSITLALIMGLPLPLLASQIIWLNLVTDGFLTVALAMEPKEKGLLKESFGRSSRQLVDSLMLQRMVVMAVPMALGSVWLFGQYYETDMLKAWTMSLTTLAIFQWFNAWNCRAERDSAFAASPLQNIYLLGATGVVLALQAAAVYLAPFQALLSTTALSIEEWVIATAIASTVLVAEEIRKFFYRRSHQAAA
ncbi:HAD-IC family P-type ATPase [Candidatus Kaiserbacteria bacterium]|nr:HAD-IC family P-type ATPase [Candidatus Kaiserbacteria bacterium]